ncbi:MAG TPA: hypothetical protein VMT03_10860 [Polyangia bacterium]|nr:hypothetical protein [Polyangia bacterium]
MRVSILWAALSLAVLGCGGSGSKYSPLVGTWTSAYDRGGAVSLTFNPLWRRSIEEPARRMFRPLAPVGH